ncbi:MAG: hypothetical protein RL166_463 [Actinomycetota bacterium]|jgi:methionine-rich copper-binding protein CopC
MNSLNKFLALVALVSLSIVPVSSASAHTETSRTTPSAGETVDAGIQTVEVVFTDKILNLADSSEISITDASGNQVETACIEVDNKSITADAFLPTSGEYKVVWRTVAEDGHPITGKFAFEVQGVAEKTDFVSCIELASQGTTVIATPKATTTEESVVVSSPESRMARLFWIGGLAAAAIAAVSYLLIRRKRVRG